MRVTIPIIDWSASRPAAILASHPSQSCNLPVLAVFVVHRADVDQLVAAGLRDQPTRLFRRKPQLLAVDVVGRNVRRSGAEILQFKRKHRKFDRLRCGGFGRLGDCEPCKNHYRSEDQSNAAHG